MRVSQAETARELRLVDAVVADDLLAHAVALARQLMGKCRISAEAVPDAEVTDVDQAEQAALRAGKRRPAVVVAIEAVKDVARLRFAEGLARERAVFQRLRVAPRTWTRRCRLSASPWGRSAWPTSRAWAWRMRQAQAATRDPR